MSNQPSVTLTELDELVKKLADKRIEIEGVSSTKTVLEKERAALENKIIAVLQEHGRTSFKSPHGTVSVTRKWSVTTPKTDEEKKQLFDWMNERGIFEQYVTVNSQSLNSLYKAELEAAEQRGEGMDFTLPGVGEPKLHETLGLRK